MPNKKKSKQRKSKTSRKKSKKDIKQVKKDIKIKIEEKEEEPEIDLEELVDSESFQEFMAYPRISTAPVLDQVAVAPQPFITLEKGIKDEPVSTSDKEEQDPFKYTPGQEQEGEIKYITDTASLGISPERPDFETVGTKPMEFDQKGFGRTETQNNSNSNRVERYDPVQSLKNKREVGMQDPIDKTKKYDFKLPNS
jgi:hypothetical protein